jgi:hypothetical protein
MHSPLLRIANPQSLNRLGHFLTPDSKSGGTPSGKNLCHPGLNLCKSVKSVGQKKSKSKNILRDLNNPAERLTDNLRSPKGANFQ